MQYTYKFTDFCKAQQALSIARRIYPNTYFYITNESGIWCIVKDYEFENKNAIKRK